MVNPPEWLVVGKIVAAFGTKGEIRVLSQTDFPERFNAGSTLFIEREELAFTVQSCRWQKGQAVIKLSGIDDRDRAAGLHGRYLRVPGTDLANLEQDQYYLFQIMGLRVVSDDGRELGTVNDILQTGANDVYVVPTPKGELLLPAIKSVIRQVDLAAGRLIVHLLPGLMPGEAAEA
jgi:16S rRNA processing protein RimM